MVGHSMTFAPQIARRSVSLDACSRVRVTSTVWPNSGSFSFHASFSCSVTVGPTMNSAGGRTFSASAVAATVASVAVTVRCVGRVAFSTSATGVSSGRPEAMSLPAMDGRLPTPM